MSWRVDKDEGLTLFNRMRGNLLALAGSDRRAMRLRALLIDRQPPRVLAAEQSFTQQCDSQSQVRSPTLMNGNGLRAAPAREPEGVNAVTSDAWCCRPRSVITNMPMPQRRHIWITSEPSLPCVAQEVADVLMRPPSATVAAAPTQPEPADAEAAAIPAADRPERRRQTPVEALSTQGSAAAVLRAAAAALAAGLNAEQRLAVQRVLGGADYSLVLGMPGTGKTSLIVAAVSKRWQSTCSSSRLSGFT